MPEPEKPGSDAQLGRSGGAAEAQPECDHIFQWHPQSDDFGVCSQCGHEATPAEIRGDVDIHAWFGLTYANYLVLPRSVLQSMPEEWQHRFTAMVDEAHDTFPDLDWPSYRVSAVDRSTGRFVRDPIPHYNRGRTRLEARP